MPHPSPVLPSLRPRFLALSGRSFSALKCTRASSDSTVESSLTLQPFAPECNSLIEAKLTHQRLLVSGHLSTPHPKHTSRIVSRYLDCGAPALALAALRRLLPTVGCVYWWNELIKRNVRLCSYDASLELFREMLRLGWKADEHTYPHVLKACGELRSFRRGASVHAVAFSGGLFECNVFVCNAVVAMYGRCGALDDAGQMFGETLVRGIDDVVSWNSMAAVYVQNCEGWWALELFHSMVCRADIELRPDRVSLVNVLPACASLGAWRQGTQIHGYAFRRGLHDDLFVGNAMLDMYAKCQFMDEANKVFERMKVKDVVSWNAMVTGYSQVGKFDDALGLFERMQAEGIKLDVITWSAVIAGYAQRGLGFECLDVFRMMRISGAEPNVVTLVSVLSGCAAVGALPQGKEIHCYAIKWKLNFNENDPGEDLMVINGLIDMYAKCKTFKVAQTVFESEQRNRNVVTWSALIGGHSQHGDANDALELFSKMIKYERSIVPNAFTVSSALVACGRLGALRLGKQIHGYILRGSYDTILFVPNCLIDMYAKSGDVDAAQRVFDNMGSWNAISWTSLLTGYGMHGRGIEAVRVFECMIRAGIPIDDITFLVLFYACSHCGLVDQGTDYFHRMSTDFGVLPEAEHYACMVDLLGRAGRLDEAMKLVTNMPMKPTPAVWVSLLSACRTHANVDIAEYAANKLSELGSENDGSYTLLSNIYANARRWKDVARIRGLMKDTGVKKRPGCSWIQGKNGTATFLAGDRSHPMSEEIYNLLQDMIQRIKHMGYVPQTAFALYDIDDEEKGERLAEHSEKLALAYGILTTAPGVPIRITKNLRVCGDCHAAIVYISSIIEHEIILRDSSRFHHFKNGSCTCKGYW